LSRAYGFRNGTGTFATIRRASSSVSILVAEGDKGCGRYHRQSEAAESGDGL
jgi:hypothetical protein